MLGGGMQSSESWTLNLVRNCRFRLGGNKYEIGLYDVTYVASTRRLRVTLS